MRTDMALTPEEITLYTQYLTEAKAALHRLMVGESARVFVDQNGERVEYAVANANRLRAYIFDLEVKLGKRTNVGPMSAGML